MEHVVGTVSRNVEFLQTKIRPQGTTGDLEHTTKWSLDSSIPGNMIQDRPSVVQGSDRPAQLLFAQAVLEVRVAELVE